MKCMYFLFFYFLNLQVHWQVTPSSRRIFWMDLQGGMKTGLWQQQLMSRSHIPKTHSCQYSCGGAYGHENRPLCWAKKVHM